MDIDLLKDRGIPLERQSFARRELVVSAAELDVFSRVRGILMNAIEAEQDRFLRACGRANDSIQLSLAKVRWVECHQRLVVDWAMPSGQSLLQTAIDLQQADVEIAAAVARAEPDPSFAWVFRHGLLDDLERMQQYSTPLDRLGCRDARSRFWDYVDSAPDGTRPPRSTLEEEQLPHYDRRTARLVTKLHALTLLSAKRQAHDHVNLATTFADPGVRELCDDIALSEERQIPRYESLIDPRETWLERWLLHEANEVYAYASAAEYETNPGLRALWERFVEYELGHVQLVADLFQTIERRDAAEVLSSRLDKPLVLTSQRDFVRRILERQTKATTPPLSARTQATLTSPLA
jgi:hypothetical protein